ncbi:AAA family ATPase [Effusibacillus consociatus]|uniref:CpaE family protein n=1 Tax=Effusibacillus consociatus TaxID=1117041 RepID=A0ABV9Q273_9BACL
MTLHWFGLVDNVKSVTTVHSAVSRTGNSVHWYTEANELQDQLSFSEGAVVFLKTSLAYNAYELCRELSAAYPYISIVLLVPAEELDLKKAMHAGAIDAVVLPSQEAEVIQAAREAESAVRLKMARIQPDTPEAPKADGRVVTICGTKGGVGKTTLTVNLAVAFSKSNLKVGVLDLDLQFGDITILFDSQPKRTIYEWVKEEYEHSRGNLDRYMIRHSSGVEILSAPLRPEFAEVVTGEHVGIIIGELRRRYDLVLIDTPPSLVETGLVALDNSADILLVASVDLPTLKNSKLCIETLESLGMKDKIKLVLNRDTKIDGITAGTVENVLGMPIYSRIPSEGKVVVASVNKGIPFVLSNPRSAVAKSVFSCAAKLQSQQRSTNKASVKKVPKKSMLARLLTR